MRIKRVVAENVRNYEIKTSIQQTHFIEKLIVTYDTVVRSNSMLSL